MMYDVAVVGAGVVGCALARRFSLAGLSVAVLDRASDVGEGGASKSNSAIAHTGFDAEPGSLEGRLVARASIQWPELASSLKIPFKQVGALMLARNAEEMAACEKYFSRAKANGVSNVELVDASTCRKMEPLAYEHENVVGGLHVAREAIVDPFATCVAFAEVAHGTGRCDFVFNTEVKSISPLLCVDENKRKVKLDAKVVINSAGLGAQALHHAPVFNLNPRRGQFLVYDSLARPLIHRILLPVPGAGGKGILITPTVFGNLLCGPTSEDLPMSEISHATQTTWEGLQQVRHSVLRTLPSLGKFSPVAQYAGARSNCEQGSYLFEFDTQNSVVTLAGIRSTGLSASFAIADHVFDEMTKLHMIDSREGASTCPGRSRYPPWFDRKPKDDDEQVCFCEGATRGDIRAALASPLCPSTTDAVKRRTRATTGRCQGFNCLVGVCKAISSERRIKVREVRKNVAGTEWFPQYSPSPLPLPTTPKLLYAASDVKEHFQVIVIGGGPAGCGVLAGLANSPFTDKLLMLERSPRLGGIPLRYTDRGKKTFLHWNGGVISGGEFAELLTAEAFSFRHKASIKRRSQVMSFDAAKGEVVTHTGQRITADFIVLAAGAREATGVERGTVTGHRPSRVVFSNHLLETGAMPGRVLSVGAGLVPRSVLFGHPEVAFASQAHDEHSSLASWYFPGGSAFSVADEELRVSTVDEGLEVAGTSFQSVVLGGCLRPNQEVLGRSDVSPSSPPSNVLLAGNCGNHSAWPGLACYLHGKHVVANQVLHRMFKRS